MSNGCYISQINKSFCSAHNPKLKNSPSSPPLALVSLPYIQGTTNHIPKIIAKNNIKTYSNPVKALKQLFRTTKDKSDPMLGT
jgi:hypothetical protein